MFFFVHSLRFALIFFVVLFFVVLLLFPIYETTVLIYLIIYFICLSVIYLFNFVSVYIHLTIFLLIDNRWTLFVAVVCCFIGCWYSSVELYQGLTDRFQVSVKGFMGSMGAPYIPFIHTDILVTPPGEKEREKRSVTTNDESTVA